MVSLSGALNVCVFIASALAMDMVYASKHLRECFTVMISVIRDENSNCKTSKAL